MELGERELLADYDRAGTFTNREIAACLRRHDWLNDARTHTLMKLLEALLQRDPPAPRSPAEAFLAAALAEIGAGFLRRSKTMRESLDEARASLAALYGHLGRSSRARQELLSLLAAVRGQEDLRLLAELTASDPPALAQRFLAPLFQYRDYDPAPLFPRLLDAVAHLPLAAAVLDLANYLTREGRMTAHPAAGRGGQLASLLGRIAQELGRMEETPPEPGEAEEVHRRVNESVSLAVSLCDALALLGDRSHAGKLYQALELGHRRIRTEAAYALAKLEEPAGREALVALAAEPVARLRVLAYAEELGVLEQVPEEYQSVVARAEAELAAWLSDATQMGLPPGKCELIDRRTQYWPGYDDPVDCFLFHFSYRLGGSVYSNVGIVGPLTHAMTADLADLPPDDIYASFAGWQAEHEEISETAPERLTPSLRRDADHLERRLREAGFENVRPVTVGSFFGDTVLVAAAEREGVPGYVVVDSEEVDWRPTAQRARPLGADEVYAIYKGRKLLKAFNP
jgi:hypothetical protein